MKNLTGNEVSSGLEIIYCDITQLSHGRSALINCIDSPADRG